MGGASLIRLCCVLCGVLAGGLVGSGRAHAQQAPEPTSAAPTNDRDRDALTAFQQGVAAAQDGDWRTAHTAFAHAYELSPRPVVLFNLAAAQIQIGRLLAGEESYRRFLDDPGDPEVPTTAERRQAAESILRDLDQRIPRVRLALTGLESNDTLELDGQSVAWASRREVRVDRGAHNLRLLRAGTLLGAVDFDVSEFEARTVTLTAPVILRPPPATNPTVPAQISARAPTEAHRPWWRSPWAWTAVAAGVVAAGAATFALTRPAGTRFVGNVGPGYVEVP